MNDTATLIIRTATDEDDLGALWGGDPAGHTFNRDQIFVAESARGIEGMVIIWDAGHSLVYVDSLVVVQDAPARTGLQLGDAVYRYCLEHGKTAVLFTSPSVEIAYMSKKRGAVVAGPFFRIRCNISDFHGLNA